MHAKSNFFEGSHWIVLISIPLWLSIFGWIKIIKGFFINFF